LTKGAGFDRDHILSKKIVEIKPNERRKGGEAQKKREDLMR
jgi:hypothetical protein